MNVVRKSGNERQQQRSESGERGERKDGYYERNYEIHNPSGHSLEPFLSLYLSTTMVPASGGLALTSMDHSPPERHLFLATRQRQRILDLVAQDVHARQTPVDLGPVKSMRWSWYQRVAALCSLR
jgi:hypothetical protein